MDSVVRRHRRKIAHERTERELSMIHCASVNRRLGIISHEVSNANIESIKRTRQNQVDKKFTLYGPNYVGISVCGIRCLESRIPRRRKDKINPVRPPVDYLLVLESRDAEARLWHPGKTNIELYWHSNPEKVIITR